MWGDIALFCLGCAFAALIITALSMPLLIQYLKAKQIYDSAHRRSHGKDPVVVGGGWAVLLAALPLISILFYVQDVALIYYGLPLGAFVLALISWWDDVAHINVAIRLLVQSLVIIPVVLFLFPQQVQLFDVLPLWADRAVLYFCLLWFTNLYNFMDGIDGLSGMQTAYLGFSIGGLMICLGVGGLMGPAYGFILGGAALSFLIWNWQPAKIYLGDVGAISLGFLMGWYVLSLALAGYFWPAVILPLYYCLDATATLIGRVLKGQTVLSAHKGFYYQAPIPYPYKDRDVVWRIAGVNLVLLLCAYLSVQADNLWQLVPALIGAFCSAYGLMLFFQKQRYS